MTNEPATQADLDSLRHALMGVTYTFAALLKHLHDRGLIDPARLAVDLRAIGHAAAEQWSVDQGFVPLQIAQDCDLLAHPPGPDAPSWLRGVIDGGMR